MSHPRYYCSIFIIFEIPARKEKIAQGTRGKSISYSDLFRFVSKMKGQKRDKYQIYQIKELFNHPG